MILISLGTCSNFAVLDNHISWLSDVDSICVGTVPGRRDFHSNDSHRIALWNDKIHLLAILDSYAFYLDRGARIYSKRLQGEKKNG